MNGLLGNARPEMAEIIPIHVNVSATKYPTFEYFESKLDNHMQKSNKLLLASVLVINVGCAGTPLRYPRMPPDEGRHSNESSRLPMPESEQDQQTDQSRERSDSPAVLALLDAAETDRQQGKLDSAVATIERALRIQPRNADLWHRLAQLRLEQEKPTIAENLARKSNTLAGSDLDLIRKNWLLVASARRLSGNYEGADDAERKAARINW